MKVKYHKLSEAELTTIEKELPKFYYEKDGRYVMRYAFNIIKQTKAFNKDTIMLLGAYIQKDEK